MWRSSGQVGPLGCADRAAGLLRLLQLDREHREAHAASKGTSGSSDSESDEGGRAGMRKGTRRSRRRSRRLRGVEVDVGPF